MSTLTTGLAGQQQLRSARRGGPDQAAWSPAALALRCGNLILVPSASGRGASSHRALPGCSSRPSAFCPPAPLDCVVADDVIVTSHVVGIAGTLAPVLTPCTIDLTSRGQPKHRPNGMKGARLAPSQDEEAEVARS
jgi:hypothetical protein